MDNSSLLGLRGLFSALGVGRLRRGGDFLGRGVVNRNVQRSLNFRAQFYRYFVLAQILDRLGQIDLLAVDFVARFLELGRDVEVSDSAKALGLALARFENEDELELAQLAGEFLRFVQLGGLALGAFAAEFLHLAFGGVGGGSGKILRNQKIAGVAGLDRDDVGFAAQAFDFSFEDDLDSLPKPSPESMAFLRRKLDWIESRQKWINAPIRAQEALDRDGSHPP